jgi:hypothetical protein
LESMSRAKQPFRQSDLTKLIKAAERAGFKPRRAIVRQDEILIDFSETSGAVEERNEWDSVK